VDGLWLPRDYLEKLQEGAAKVLGRAEGSNPLYLLVEKILLGDERLRDDWPVHGTTGYDFTNEVTGLFVDPAAEKSMTETYDRFINGEPRFDDIAYMSKELVMRLSLAGEINMLAHMLDRLSEKNRWYRDFTLNSLTFAVREVIACFPVYRTYVGPDEEPGAADREAVLRAVRMAKRRNPGIERSIFNFVGEILLKKFPENIDDAARAEHMRFVMKLQQCAGPVMAKGVEDTAFYIYNRLVALNEVGGEPGRFGMVPGKFFEKGAARLKDHPHAMLATTTHDTKRSEDTRARMAAISEFTAPWRKSLRRWHIRNRRLKRDIDGESAPSVNEEYLLYQALLGTWPLEPLTPESRAIYIQRIQDYMIKALKEAKVNTSWIQPNEDWEDAARGFVAEALKEGTNRFLNDFAPFAAQVAQTGMINSLSQLVIKCTAPGVPDFYQGSELWDFRLVDPDNRQPVDYESRKNLLEPAEKANAVELFKQWRDGRIKLFLTRALLHFRLEHAELFANGDFIPLRTGGAYPDSCLAFLRTFENDSLLVVAPRLTQKIGFPPVGAAWRDTAIELPQNAMAGKMHDLLTGRELDAGGGPIHLADALRELPVAVYATERTFNKDN